MPQSPFARSSRVPPRQRRPRRIPSTVHLSGTGDEVETVIERIVPGGFGLGYADSRTLFVSQAAPGDQLRVRIERVQGRVAHASIVGILAPGPGRIEEAFPLLSRCGADFQHLRYETQLEAKSEIVGDSLRRIGGIDLAAPVPIVPSPVNWHYRSRADWRHDPRQPALGYFETGSHQVIDLPQDPFVVPALAERFQLFRDRLADGRLPDWATELRAAAGDDGVSVAPPLELPQTTPVHATVGGERFVYDADCFFQVNPHLLTELVDEALRFAPPAGAASESLRAIDLFCGVGLFTVSLARRYSQIIGVEGHAHTAAFASQNLMAAGLTNARIATASVESWLEDAYRSHGRPALVVLDPPRAGLPGTALRSLIRLRATRIAYVSCDPATLARDLKGLVSGGYELISVTALDMFPQTHHVEAVAHLERVQSRET
jgi:23S rRNA (uracil1939-C5)-methyltransferase